MAHPNLGMDGATFYRASVGDAASSGTPLFALGSTVRLLWYDWLPDGGGFLFARTTDFNTTNFATANLFEYSFATGETTQLTHFADEFVRSFGIAPDGQTIVFERAPTLDGEESDLWLMARNGENQRLLVVNGRAPSWSNVDTVQPGATPQPTPEATPTPRPSATPRPGNSTAPAAYLPLVQR